ncbi:MAG: hypothetical protein HYY93_12205 [Planctomycetes bacterium]|nr:hypothetical protein [Planctomycetota bacterium]
MGTFRIDGEILSTAPKAAPNAVPQMLVDCGSEFTWVPEPILRKAGVRVVKKDLAFSMANGQTVTRSAGYAILRAGGFETVDEVVFAQPGDLTLLGARTLEGFGANVDARRRRLVASGPHIAASGRDS